MKAIICGGDNELLHLQDWVMEIHHYCGPSPVNPKTGEPREGTKRFYDAYERWELGGSLIDRMIDVKYPVCVVPQWCSKCDGKGQIHNHLGGRHWMLQGDCPKCKGGRLEWRPPVQTMRERAVPYKEPPHCRAVEFGLSATVSEIAETP